jgi:hypothetical protein
VIIYELEPFNLNYNGRNAKQCVLLLQAIRVPQPIILDYLFFDCNDFGFRSSKLVNKTLFHFCVYVDVNVSQRSSSIQQGSIEECKQEQKQETTNPAYPKNLLVYTKATRGKQKLISIGSSSFQFGPFSCPLPLSPRYSQSLPLYMHKSNHTNKLII